MSPLAVEAGADILVVQSTVTTARHSSNSVQGLQFPELLKMVDVPILVGNCVGYEVAMEIMETTWVVFYIGQLVMVVIMIQ